MASCGPVTIRATTPTRMGCTATERSWRLPLVQLWDVAVLRSDCSMVAAEPWCRRSSSRNASSSMAWDFSLGHGTSTGPVHTCQLPIRRDGRHARSYTRGHRTAHLPLLESCNTSRVYKSRFGLVAQSVTLIKHVLEMHGIECHMARASAGRGQAGELTGRCCRTLARAVGGRSD